MSRTPNTSESLLCSLGWHSVTPFPRYNNGFYFATCKRCGNDLVRTTYSGWHIPAGHRIVWQREAPDRAPQPAIATDDVSTMIGRLERREASELIAARLGERPVAAPAPAPSPVSAPAPAPMPTEAVTPVTAQPPAPAPVAPRAASLAAAPAAALVTAAEPADAEPHSPDSSSGPSATPDAVDAPAVTAGTDAPPPVGAASSTNDDETPATDALEGASEPPTIDPAPGSETDASPPPSSEIGTSNSAEDASALKAAADDDKTDVEHGSAADMPSEPTTDPTSLTDPLPTDTGTETPIEDVSPAEEAASVADAKDGDAAPTEGASPSADAAPTEEMDENGEPKSLVPDFMDNPWPISQISEIAAQRPREPDVTLMTMSGPPLTPPAPDGDAGVPGTPGAGASVATASGSPNAAAAAPGTASTPSLEGLGLASLDRLSNNVERPGGTARKASRPASTPARTGRGWTIAAVTAGIAVLAAGGWAISQSGEDASPVPIPGAPGSVEAPALETSDVQGAAAGVAFIDANRLNCRAQPTRSAASVAILERGRRVRVTAERGEWSSLAVVGGNVCWTQSRFLSDTPTA